MKTAIKIAVGTAAALLLAKGLDNRVETSYYSVSSPKIPKEFNHFKIVQISDYHNDPVPGLIEEISHEAPDLIVMTGDMTHDKFGTFTPAVELVKRLMKIAPCIMVSGNHDVWRSDYREFVRACKNAGAVFLQNERKAIVKNGQKIYISGMEDVFTKTRMQKTINQYLENFSTTEEFQIMLFHRANALDSLKDYGFDLILSGHMHGGQIRIPGFGGLLAPLSSLGDNSKLFFPKYFGGRYESEKSVMIVNRGLGNPMPVPRFFNRPEIGVILLNHPE